MIVKCQASFNKVGRVLIYNESRTFQVSLFDQDFWKKVYELGYKAFFSATVDKEEKLVIGKQLPDQYW